MSDGDESATIAPYNGFRVSFSMDFDHPAMKNHSQEAAVDFSSGSFVKEVSRARPFFFLKDFKYFQGNNLAKVASTDNSIVLDDDRVLNEEGLRYEDEFVRYKVQGAIGDLYLLGYNLVGEFKGINSGHSLNNRLVRELLALKDAWEILIFEE